MTQDQSSAETIRIGIKGMTCAACVARVERKLQKQPGVESATVNLATESATVGYLPEAVAPKQIFEAIARAGYEPVETADTDDEGSAREIEDRDLLKDLRLAAALLPQSGS